MISRWQDSQIEVWEVNTEGKLLEPCVARETESLARKTRHRAELKHALRQIRRPESGKTFGSFQGSGHARSLEEVVGHHAKYVWETFFRSLASHPRAIAAIADAAGYQSYDLLANLIGVVNEDSLLSTMQRGEGSALPLDDVLDFELHRLLKPGEPLQIQSLLSDKFLSTLLKVITINAPACIAWSHCVLSEDVMEAVEQTIPNTASQSSSSNNSSPTNASRQQQAKARPPSGTNVGSANLLQTLEDFCAPPGSPSATSSFCRAAEALVMALCKHAVSVPPGLCQLAYIFSQKIARQYPDQDEEAIQHSILGHLLLNGWIVVLPWLEGIGGTLGLAIHADPQGTHQERITLTKLLKAIALNTEIDLPDLARKLNTSIDLVQFVRRESERLRNDFFKVLLIRGRSLSNSTSCRVPHAAARNVQSGSMWPRCFACSTKDLSYLSKSLADLSEEATERLLDKINGDECHVPKAALQAVAALGESSQQQQPNARRLSEESRAVICWLQQTTAPTLESIASREVSIQGRPGSTGGTDVERATETIVSGDAGGTISIITETPVLTGSSADLTSIPTNGSSSSCEDLVDTGLLELVWKCLAVPHPLDASVGGSLLQALEAQGHHKFGCIGEQQTCVEMLVEALRNCLVQSRGIDDMESRLFRGLQNMIQTKQSHVASLQHALVKMQVASQLVEQDCTGLTDALKHCARLAAEHRCNKLLTQLWHAPPSSPSKEGRSPVCCAPEISSASSPVLEFCILSPPVAKLPTRATIANHSTDSVLSGSMMGTISRKSSNASQVFATSMGSSKSVPAPSTGLGEQTKVQIIPDQRDCEIHKFQKVGRALAMTGSLQPDHKVKHRTPKGIRQALMAFNQLPLDTVVLGNDRLCIAEAIHTVLGLIADRFLEQCYLEGCQLCGSIDRRSSSFNSYTSDCDDNAPSVYVGIDVEHIKDYIARYFFQAECAANQSNLHKRLFPKIPTDADINTRERISKLMWLKPKHLDVPCELLELRQVEDAVLLLRRLHMLRSPSEMVEALQLASKKVGDAASLKSNLRLTKGEKAFGTDDLLPLLILVVIKANPERLSSVLEYINRLWWVPPPRANAPGFALATLETAWDFIMNLSPENLSGLMPGEWEQHMGTTGRRSAHSH